MHKTYEPPRSPINIPLAETRPLHSPNRVNSNMLSRGKSFVTRLWIFVQRLPQLWTSINTDHHAYGALYASDITLPGGYANSLDSRNRRLFDMDKLSIPDHQREMFLVVNKLVLEYMYGDQYDPSHDYEHIQRVVKYTHELYLAEKKVGHVNPGTNITTMYLGAMMHDVGETKYLEKGRTQEEVVVEKMLECGATPKLANDVATIAVNVSFTREITATDRTRIHAIIEHHPELAFVQDADRLDALGPSGQARCFVYGGANPRRRQQTIHTSIQLHHKRFQYYVPLMKTRSGRVRAEQKWAWMEHHRQEWHEDTDVSTVL